MDRPLLTVSFPSITADRVTREPNTAGWRSPEPAAVRRGGRAWAAAQPRLGLPDSSACAKALIGQCTTCDVNGYVPGGEAGGPITIICSR
jgi:hypothetical protein